MRVREYRERHSTARDGLLAGLSAFKKRYPGVLAELAESIPGYSNPPQGVFEWADMVLCSMASRMSSIEEGVEFTSTSIEIEWRCHADDIVLSTRLQRGLDLLMEVGIVRKVRRPGKSNQYFFNIIKYMGAVREGP